MRRRRLFSPSICVIEDGITAPWPYNCDCPIGRLYLLGDPSKWWKEKIADHPKFLVNGSFFTVHMCHPVHRTDAKGFVSTILEEEGKSERGGRGGNTTQARPSGNGGGLPPSSHMHNEYRFISDTLHCVSSLRWGRGSHVLLTGFYCGKGRKCGAMSWN